MYLYIPMASRRQFPACSDDEDDSYQMEEMQIPNGASEGLKRVNKDPQMAETRLAGKPNRGKNTESLLEPDF